MEETRSPLVTAIIPFYNDDAYLAETIESVIHQDFTDWELLLIDDGSSDNSTAIAKKYAAASGGKIIYVEHPGHTNKGVCVSRNLGVERARGKYVAILDSDDIWLPGKLTQQVELMQKYPDIGMLCEASEYWFNWQDKAKQNEVIQVGTSRDKVFYPPELLNDLYPLAYGRAPVPSGIMLKKSAILNIGGFEENFTGMYQLYEDQAFLCKMYLHEPVYISSACNHRYRQRKGSVVQKVTVEGNYYVVRRYFLEWLKKYVEQKGIKGREITRLLKRALVPYHQPRLHYFQQLRQRMQDRLGRLLGR